MRWHGLGSIICAAFVVLTSSTSAAQPVCGSNGCEPGETIASCAADCGILDDFEDMTTQGWVVGSNHNAPPVNTADAGPTGAGDEALTAVDGGMANRLLFFNESQWVAEDWTVIGRTRIYAHVRNTGSVPLVLRLAMTGNGGRIGGNTGVTVPADGAYHTVSWPCEASDFSAQGVSDPMLTLQNPSQIRITHATTPTFLGDAVDGELVIDNISDQPLAPICGDGEMNGGDACDDGNVVSDDGCSATCAVESCGDGVVQPSSEECDDASSNSDTVADACRTDCSDPSCGDDVIDSGESCDDGSSNSDTVADACRTDCSSASCGDDVVDTGEDCDDGAGNSDTAADACRADCSNPSCGDGVTDTGEQCDDGNTTAGDGCGATCMMETPPDMGTGGMTSTDGSSCAAGAPGGSGAGAGLLLVALGLLWRRRR